MITFGFSSDIGHSLPPNIHFLCSTFSSFLIFLSLQLLLRTFPGSAFTAHSLLGGHGPQNSLYLS